jgi:hypothetical protein
MNILLGKIEKTPGSNHLSKEFPFDTMEEVIRIFNEKGVPLRRS